MTQLAPHLRSQFEKLNALSDEELDKECSAVLEITASHLLKLALIVRIKEDRGHDLSKLRIGMLNDLRAIAAGTLLPQCVVQSAENPGILREVKRLSIPDQRKWLKGDLEVSQRRYRNQHSQHRAVVVPVAPFTPTQIIVDVKNGAIVVSGTNVVISREQLEVYLSQLPEKPWMCRDCGEIFGTVKPSRCPKCRSSSFEKASPMAIAS